MTSLSVKAVLILLSLYSLSSEIFGQNLIQNGSFEELSLDCPYNTYYDSEDFPVKSWKVACQGAQSFHRTCFNQVIFDKNLLKKHLTNWKDTLIGRKVYGVPKNFQGQQEPHDGDAFVGMRVYPYDGAAFIQNSVLQPLVKDTRYYLEFWVSRSELYCTSVDNIGAKFLPKEIKRTNDEEEIIALKAEVIHSYKNYIEDTKGWTKISGYFYANGDEKVILVGVFLRNTKIRLNNRSNTVKTYRKYKTKELCGKGGVGYYYFDDFKLYPVDENGNEIKWQKEEVIATEESIYKSGDVLTIGHVSFESGSSKLKELSFPQLDKLVASLQNTKQTVEIIGHTDNTGTEEENIHLSKERAGSVSEYLISKGIASDRIKVNSMGSSKPISGNETEEGRSTNRRVEIIILD